MNSAGDRHRSLSKYNVGIRLCYVLHNDIDSKSKHLLLDIYVCRSHIGMYRTFVKHKQMTSLELSKTVFSLLSDKCLWNDGSVGTNN